ncbi:RNA-binding domain-containing protein [Ascoidea rubescens DSM 1968]|uniref:RNA-binding domain-containing protein n=1 Tax=Ascoidea rubescens DSM 1968 TaxID=1344418 RepID=A0A1D2V8G4_9ASCO|nr:RNA-binding domain-containing protein [Ascoidea rubescens DSM 1968]ODV57966.1 RNA-binding domain-containing protein [Ascoidea rubescens DSM 1968]
MSNNQFNSEFPIVLVKNLPYEVTTQELYDLFNKFGNIIEVRKGIENHLKGNCFVVYSDLKSAKSCLENLNGFNFKSRYLVALLYQIDSHKINDIKNELIQVNNKSIHTK